MSRWATDFLGYPDAVMVEERKDRLLGFIRYGVRENPGVIALVVSILGVNHLQALEVFCNVHTNFGLAQSKKSNCVDFNADKLKAILRERKITNKEIARQMGCCRQTINNLFYYGECRKSKKFVDKIEKILNLPQGSLIKGDQNESGIACRL